MIPVDNVLILSSILFGIGVFGVLSRTNAISIFLSIELMLNAVNLAFVGFATSLNSMDGVMVTFFVIIIAAAEAVVGLAIVISMHRNKSTINVEKFNLLKF